MVLKTTRLVTVVYPSEPLPLEVQYWAMATGEYAEKKTNSKKNNSC